MQVYARIDRERLWPYMGGIAKQNGTIPKRFGNVSEHPHLCISQLQETVHPIEQQLEQHRTLGLAAPDHTVPCGTVLSRDVVPGTSCHAPKGLEDSAQGFNPGNRRAERRALKGRQIERTDGAAVESDHASISIAHSVLRHDGCEIHLQPPAPSGRTVYFKGSQG